MNFLRCAAVTASVAILSSGALAQQSDVFATGDEWTNELGSVLTIDTVEPSGDFTGTYVSAVGCDAGTEFPVMGTIQGVAITFSVNWGSACASVTAWTGAYDASDDAIQTLWYLALDEATWNGVLAGADTFTR